MSSKDKTVWYKSKEHFRKYPSRTVKIDGLDVSLMDPRDLVAYKKHLDGEHQEVDVVAVERFISENGLDI